MRRRELRPAGSAVRDLAEQLAPPTTLAAVQGIWAQAAGEAFAAQCTPVAEAGGTLTVTCSSAVWAQELDLLAGPVLERLDAELGPGRITALRCRTAAPRGGGRPPR
jgi:predicted nucleic acid-binding Zn ribbon protein